MMNDCEQTREPAEIILELAHRGLKPGGMTQQLARELMPPNQERLGPTTDLYYSDAKGELVR